MDEITIKNSFQKVKEDINTLKSEISELKSLMFSIKSSLTNTTLRQLNSTHPVNSTDTSTVPQEIEGLKTQNLRSSTGNRGVSTDRQTHQQTDKISNFTKNNSKNIDFNISEASELLDSLDEIKQEISIKFKKITPQELAVFSSIYLLEEQTPNNVTYHNIAKKLNLSQSSIRDYVQRMILKGIPIKKSKINNKKIILSISSELRRIASLNTIIKLRGL